MALGKAVPVQRVGSRFQRTLAAPAEIRGVGLVTGSRVRVRFMPAPADSGIAFIRTDLPASPTTLARADRVTATNRRTTLGPAEAGVTLVEHVLSALAGLRIDNCLIEIDGPEPPGLDGSARGFVQALQAVGTTLLPGRRAVFIATEPVVLAKDGATIAFYPPESCDGFGLRVSYVLDYGPTSAIARQAVSFPITPETFTRELSGCRTFLLESEAASLRAQGIGKHLAPSDLLVFGPRGPVGNKLRHADEPARHKVLDLVGDLALCGFDLAGHVVAYKSGHSLNAALANTLLKLHAVATSPKRVAA